MLVRSLLAQVLSARALPVVGLQVSPLHLSTTCTKDDVSLCGIVFRFTKNEGLGQVLEVVLGKPLRILLIIILALLIRRALLRVIHRLTERIAAGIPASFRHRGTVAPAGAVTAPAVLASRREARARTLASVLRSVTSAVIAVVVVLMVLQELDFSVAPLLASAGVVGIALGLGAQSLVRDVVAGMFMIVEDQYGVGDVVDVGAASGSVEGIGLRVTRLRDVNGTVWYVRNGEILRVGNQSQGWSRTVLDLNIDYAEDLDRVERVLLDVAGQVKSAEKFAPYILGEPEIWGVEALTTDGVLMRLVVTTQPLQASTVARELRRRIKARFDTEGIEMRPAAPPTVTVTVNDEDLQSTPRGDDPLDDA